MDKKGLTYLIQTVVTLKEKLTCPICLDVMQDIVELDCSHKFCKECYSEYKYTEKQVTCPLCKKVLKRRTTTYNDPFANSLGKFVYETCNDIKKNYNCEVEQLQKKLNEEKGPVLKDVTSNSKTSSLLLTSKASKVKKKIEPHNLLKVDAFDRLMNTVEKPSRFNKNGTKRQYINKKKIEKEFEMKYDNLQFDHYENKVAVLKWLNDGKNKFDRITQTQNIHSDEESELPSSTDIVSISQVREEIGEPTVNKYLHKGRAKSLDIEIKKVLTRQKRFSEGGKTDIIENYDIEEINTEEEEVVKKVEEKVLLDIIEDEILNKLESEMQEPKLKSKREGKNLTSDASKGWERITKIKKTMKGKKIPKQLSVTLQPTQVIRTEKEVEKVNSRPTDITTEFPKNSDDKIRMLSSKRRLKIILQNIDRSKCHKDSKKDTDEPSKRKTSDCQNENIYVEKGKTYDLNELEDYFANNIKVMEKNTSLDSSTTSPLVEKKDNKRKKIDIIETKEKNNLILVNVPNVSLETDKKSNCALINDIDEILLDLDESSQKHVDNISREVEGNKEVIVMIEDDESYDTPTQKLVHSCKNAQHGSDETFQSRTDFLNIFETTLEICLKNLNLANLDVIEDQLLTMRSQILKLKPPVACDASTQINLETIDVKIQTEVKIDTTGIQTEVYNKNAAMQTEDLCCPKCDFCFVDRESSFPSEKSDSDQKANKPKSQTRSDIFTATFDDLNFETQEVVKNQGTILKNTQKQVQDSQHQSRVCHSQKTQHLPASMLVCSLDNTTTSKKGTQKRYKRIRMPAENDSDEENQPKKVCNKFIRDDLTVEFQTNTGAVSAETQNSEGINYDDYLAQVIKKYEDDVFPVPSLNDKSKGPHSGKTVIKEIVSKCEEMLGQASKNVQHIKELAELSSSSKESYQTASQNFNNDCNEILSADNVFMDENNLLKLERDIQDYERDRVKQETESTDVIINTEEIEPLSKKVKKITGNCGHKLESASLFGKSDYNTLHRRDNSNKVCNGLNDIFDEANLEDIDLCKKQNINNRPASKINIIDNVVIRSPNKDENQEKEEDLFSDEDFVETTPQKQTSSIMDRSELSVKMGIFSALNILNSCGC